MQLKNSYSKQVISTCHGDKNRNEFETPKFGDMVQIISVVNDKM